MSSVLISFSTQNNIQAKKSKDPFYDIFFGMDMMNDACYNCNSRSTMAYGDIRLGDYWGENMIRIQKVFLQSF